jgi:UDP-galactopyranose mutase
VIDERMDMDLIDALARRRPNWQIVMLGPVTKLADHELPRHSNLHYLGARPYADLPAYLAGWDVALMPFALNDATRYISPTKTPEYLAAGKPVVSTALADVIEPFERKGLVRIGRSTEEFLSAIERALEPPTDGWLQAVDTFLAASSWEDTWSRMMQLVQRAPRKSVVSPPPFRAAVAGEVA